MVVALGIAASAGARHHPNNEENPVQLALRPYVTAGVALAGAGLIAATPTLIPPCS